MFYQYPAIGDENVFQEFCKDVYNAIYVTTDFQSYKTKGAVQHGIDCYSLQFEIVIQSKKKKLLRSDKELEKELQNDLNETVELVKNLPFPFKYLIFATNTKKYSSIQNLAATLSQSLNYQIKFVSWEEFEIEITKHSIIRKTYFPDFYHADGIYPKILSNLPHADPSTIIGRDKELQMLENILMNSTNTILLNGMGGIGKTTLLKHLLQQIIKHYSHILWIDYIGSADLVDEENQLIRAFTENLPLIKNLGIDLDKEVSDRDLLALINNKLVNMTGSNLLIVDNAPHPFAKLSQYLPGYPGWKVLISSRYKITGTHIFEVTFLNRQQALSLFYRYYDREKDDSILIQILSYTGFHTLTVELLAKTANKRRLLLKELQALLDSDGLNISKAAKVTSDHDLAQTPTNYFAYLLSIFSIAKLGNAEQQILKLLSVIPSESISYDSLKLIFDVVDDDNEFFENINTLTESGWLVRQDDQYQMHQVIQEVIREKLKPDENSCRDLIRNLTSILLLDFGENPFKVKKIADYAGGVLFFIKSESVDIAALCNALGLRDEDLNNFEKALNYLHKAEAIYENEGSDQILELAGVYNNLQSVYKTLGQIDIAFNYQLKAIAIQEKELHPASFDLGSSYNNIALVYEIKGDLKNALKYMARAVVIAEHCIEGDHPYLASTYSSLSIMLNRAGDDAEALAYQKKAYAMRLKVLEPDHPQLDESRSNMAAMYEAIGELDLAEELIRQSISYKEKVYGPDDFRLGTAYNNLAAIFIKRRNFDTAESYQLKAIELEENGLGKNHHEVATSYSTLAVIKNNQKKFSEGILYAQKAIEIFQLNFPEGHPNIQMYEQFIHITKSKMSQNSQRKIGRNDLCPCGSQKKYKNCCGK